MSDINSKLQEKVRNVRFFYAVVEIGKKLNCKM